MKLKSASGKNMYVNLATIKYIMPAESGEFVGSLICFEGGDKFVVLELPETIFLETQKLES